MRHSSRVQFVVVFGLIAFVAPSVASAQGAIEGNVAFWGDPGGGTQIEIAAHSDPYGAPDATVFVDIPGGSYSLPVADGTYYVSAWMSRNRGSGEPQEEDVFAWYDADGDGDWDPVTVSGGVVTGVDIDMGFVYVDIDATSGANNGSSWADAFTDLQDGIDLAVSGIEVWVAEGTYLPGATRSDSILPKPGVRVCGGFAGSETNRYERDWTLHPTILSGDIPGDNSYHVVLANGANPTAILDGLTITQGLANGGSTNDHGAGVLAIGGGVTLANVTLVDNSAAGYGGGIYTDNPATVAAVNTGFVSNDAVFAGGGFYMDAQSGTPSMAVNCVFTGNTAWRGAGIAVEGQVFAPGLQPILVNLSLSGNAALLEGGGIFTNTTTFSPPGGAPVSIENTILWGNTGPNPQISVWGGTDQPIVNHSIVQGGWTGPGTHIVNQDPSFADPDLRLNLDSPAIDAGDNYAVPLDIYDADGNHWTGGPIVKDRAFNWRFEEIPYVPNTGVTNPGDDPIDMGAYETKDAALIFFATFEAGDLDEWDNVVGGI